MPDTPQRNLAIMTSAFEALNRRDLEAITAVMTEDFDINVAGSPRRKGIAAWRSNVEIMFKAFPDAKVEVRDMFAGDDKVAVRIRMTGTHGGDFLGLPASGKLIDYESSELYQITPEGRIAGEWICSDTLTMMTQIGVYSGSRLVWLWLASFKVWIAAIAGFALGGALFAFLL